MAYMFSIRNWGQTLYLNTQTHFMHSIVLKVDVKQQRNLPRHETEPGCLASSTHFIC